MLLRALLLLPACHDDDPTGTDDASVPEGPTIADALGDCEGYQRVPPDYPNQLAAGTEMQRYTLQAPEALCNDGTPAVLYVRPFTDPALETVWELHLQGGGACGSWPSCVERWCGLGYYDSSKMSSANLPLQIDGFGIYDASEANGLSGANHAFFYYCSSDSWSGQGLTTYAAPEDAGELPADLGELPDYTLLKSGHLIVEAALDELEAGVVADDGLRMPSLRDATVVLWNGTSGGAAGAVVHADLVRERLDQAEVVSIFDANITPVTDSLPDEWATALQDQYRQSIEQNIATSDTPLWVDQSCEALLGSTDAAWQCQDLAYVLLNHVTTPFFVRQDLRDLTERAEVAGIPEDTNETATADTLARLARVPIDAVEADQITVTPGAYGPNCAQHVALESTNWWAVRTVDDADGVPTSFQAAVGRWYYEGEAVQIIDDPVDGPGNGLGSSCD